MSNVTPRGAAAGLAALVARVDAQQAQIDALVRAGAAGGGRRRPRGAVLIWLLAMVRPRPLPPPLVCTRSSCASRVGDACEWPQLIVTWRLLAHGESERAAAMLSVAVAGAASFFAAESLVGGATLARLDKLFALSARAAFAGVVWGLTNYYIQKVRLRVRHNCLLVCLFCRVALWARSVHSCVAAVLSK